jgi:hypothetical protein
MRYHLRTFLLFVLIHLGRLTSACYADGSYDVLRLLISNAELVVLAEVEGEGIGGLAHEAGTRVSYVYNLRIAEVLKGTAPPTKLIDVDVDLISDHPYQPLKKGDKRVFFIKKRRTEGDVPYWRTDDVRFSVQPPSLANEIKRLEVDRSRLESLQRRR